MARRSRRPPSGPSLGPLIPVVVLALVGIGAAGFFHGLKREGEAGRETTDEPSPATDPFASLPPEVPPALRPQPGDGPARDRVAEPAPEPAPVTADDPRWARALELGQEAEALALEARRAKERDDHALFQEKGKAAKETFDEAFTVSVEYEAELVARLGEDHPTVRSVVRVRNGWQDEMRVFHRTTGR